MSVGHRVAKALALALLFGWIWYVLDRYRLVDAPEPLVRVMLIVGWLGWFSAATIGVGSPLWRFLSGSVGFERADLPVVLALGALGLSGVAALLSLPGWFRPAPLLAVLAVTGLAGTRELFRLELAPTHMARGLRWPAALLVVAAGLTILALPTDSPWYDQLHYHLAFPAQWLRAGHIFVLPRQVYSFLPAEMGILYAFGLAALGPSAAQAVSWWTGAVAAAALAVLATWLAGPRAGAWAAALFATTPAVVLLSTWAAADLGAACFAAAAWLMLMRAVWRPAPTSRLRWWAGAGALAGAAAGCKVLALATATLPLAVVAFLLPRQGGSPRRLPRMLAWGLGAAVGFGPWLLRNLLLVGNPVYPFLSGLFGDGSMTTDGGSMAGGIIAVPETPFSLGALASLTTFAPGGDAGAIGPAWLALLPLAGWTAIRHRGWARPALVIGALLGIAGWALGPLRGRYLLPALPPLAVLIAVGAVELRHRLPPLARRTFAFLLAGVFAWGVVGGTSQIETVRIACTLGTASREELMSRWVSYWPAVPYLNEELPAEARVLLVGESRSLYLQGDLVVEDPVRMPLLTELAISSSSSGEIAGRLHAMGITHLLVNWHEADRIAAFNLRQHYFELPDAASAQRLDGFLRDCLTREFSRNVVEVYRLGGCVPAPGPR